LCKNSTEGNSLGVGIPGILCKNGCLNKLPLHKGRVSILLLDKNVSNLVLKSDERHINGKQKLLFPST
jgi:hypothetical protein